MWKLFYLFLFAGLFLLAGCAASSDDFTNGESGSAANSNGEQGGEGNPTQPALYNKWEITGKTALLNSDGTLSAWGWSRHPYMEYNKEMLADAQKKRLKEWDFYSVYNNEYCFEITMANISWMVLITVSFSDYRTKENFSNMRIVFDTSVLELERNPYDDITYENGGVYSAFTNFKGIRTLDFEFSKVALLFPEIRGKINIQDDPEDDSLATAAPFNEPGSFFYTDKVFAKKASGSVFVKGKEYIFDERDSYAVLDWGRGVWPKEFEWGWAVASGEVDGKVLGFNFGFGEENSSRFACNAVVYDGVLHKMGRIKWDYNKDDIMQPWFFRSDDGRFDMKMECDFDHSNNIDLGFYYMKTIQPRGRFHGKVVLDDGRALNVHGILGFAEHCFQKW